MSSTIGLYFDLSQEGANALRDRLNSRAARLGYTARRGPTAGAGNLAALLQALEAADCEIRRLRWWASNDADLFDGVIGWGQLYPPDDSAVQAALAAVPESYRAAIDAAYSAEGISLRAVLPGTGLDYGGRSDRWAIALDDDWSVDFGRALERHAGLPPDAWRDDDLRAAAYSFALDIATATDQALIALLGDDPTAGQGTRWGIDEDSGRAWFAAH